MSVVRSRSYGTALSWLLLIGACLNGPGATAASPRSFDDSVERYRSYLAADIANALAGALQLRDRANANDVNGAKQSWINARAGWERSEVFTGGFVPDLDRQIDAWPQAASGFHAIEAKLFGANRTDIDQEAQALIESLTTLNRTLNVIPLDPQGLLNGMAQLVYELGESKVDGGESRLSGTSLADMRNNVVGITQAYQTILAEAVERADPSLDAAAVAQIRTLKEMLDTRNLKEVDPDRLRAASEELLLTLERTALAIGLQKPALESSAP